MDTGLLAGAVAGLYASHGVIQREHKASQTFVLSRVDCVSSVDP